MNRRSFLSSLAALSLPAVVAGKVAEIAGYGEPYQFTDRYWFDMPVDKDLWKTMDYFFKEQQKRVGLSDILYAGSSRPCTATPIG